MSDTFMCMECAENCHGKAKDFTICSACRTGYEAEIERLRAALDRIINMGWPEGRGTMENKYATQVVEAKTIAREALAAVEGEGDE